MSYPGKATLTREMQERILSTFRQTLTAAAAGNRQEAKLGCDFILRLDSLFGPARELLERLEVGEGPVSTEDLTTAVGLAPEKAPAAPVDVPPVAEPPSDDPGAAAAAAVVEGRPPDIDDLSDLDLEMGLSDPVPAQPEPAAAPEPAPAPPEPAAPMPPEPKPPGPAAAAPPPAAEEPLSIDPLDDLDIGPGEAVEAPPVLEPEPISAEPPAVDAPPVAPPPVEPELPEPAPVLEPELPEPPPPVEEPPPVDELDDLDVGPGEAVEAAPVPEPEPIPVEPPAPEAAAEPEATAEPSEPEAPEASGLDELDDLDLSGGAEADTPPAAEEAPEEPAPAAEEAVGEPVAPAEAASEEVQEAAPAEAPEEQPAAPPPESVEIPLGTEPSARLDSESQQRIDDLLAEGQEAFNGGEYQGAIDAWSRIFLIDIDHAEANQRIEEARKLKAEADRKVEEKFHEALTQLESGDTDAAADSFRAVLGMQSSHLAARDYLEKLEAGEVPVPTELSRPAEADPAADLAEPGLEIPDEGDGEPEVKPDRGTKAVGESMVSVKKSLFKSKAFMAVAAVGLVAVLGGAWYLFNNWSKLFPNSAQEAPEQTAPDPVARAKGLHEQGKTPIAIAQLRRLPPVSPQYDEAQALIAQWELEQAPAGLAPEGPSPQELARREALVAEAGAAAERREFMRTSELLSEAATVAPLKGPEVQLLARADEQLQELQNFITIFREGEWDLALRDLWLLHESDPGNRDVTRLLVDSYYNIGLRALQRKDVKVAAEQFKEALELSPNDPELLRLADFAATYQARSTDLLYRIYVKYHPFR